MKEGKSRTWDALVIGPRMGAVYDTLHLADALPLAPSRPYEAQARDLTGSLCR
ncbi:hypothetical protein KX928_13805 [Roseobacter sp. YSTF-M11]|uniref:Uncharacterized protein n=1 Tax=Roseobacter insulae TaxID=2859783 RepID=A0A9X1FVM5_9RHOB|nr:hypothetical protein [Roseobacter insulae]MBW4708860.1 hypothetical protein [Roseobacter insulae]